MLYVIKMANYFMLEKSITLNNK